MEHLFLPLVQLFDAGDLLTNAPTLDHIAKEIWLIPIDVEEEFLERA